MYMCISFFLKRIIAANISVTFRRAFKQQQLSILVLSCYQFSDFCRIITFKRVLEGVMAVYCPMYDPDIGWYIVINGPHGPEKKSIKSPLHYYYTMGVDPPVGASFTDEDYDDLGLDLDESSIGYDNDYLSPYLSNMAQPAIILPPITPVYYQLPSTSSSNINPLSSSTSAYTQAIPSTTSANMEPIPSTSPMISYSPLTLPSLAPVMPGYISTTLPFSYVLPQMHVPLIPNISQDVSKVNFVPVIPYTVMYPVASPYSPTHDLTSSYDASHDIVSSYDAPHEIASPYDASHEIASSYNDPHHMTSYKSSHDMTSYSTPHDPTSYDISHDMESVYDIPHDMTSSYGAPHSVSTYTSHHNKITYYNNAQHMSSYELYDSGSSLYDDDVEDFDEEDEMYSPYGEPHNLSPLYGESHSTLVHYDDPYEFPLPYSLPHKLPLTKSGFLSYKNQQQ